MILAPFNHTQFFTLLPRKARISFFILFAFQQLTFGTEITSTPHLYKAYERIKTQQHRISNKALNRTLGTSLTGASVFIKNSVRDTSTSENVSLNVLDGRSYSSQALSDQYLTNVFPNKGISQLGSIKPTDIDFLKKDATAIHCSCSANAVVSVTTKGKKNGKISSDITVSKEISPMANKLDLQNTKEHLGMRKKEFLPST